jgi:monoamine oxidase
MSGAERHARVQEKIKPLQKHVEAVSATHKLRAAQPAARRPDVVIVGAGFAGLMAGYSLAGCCNVTIHEARNRVGGRVWSKNENNRIIEAGGELIGYDHPLWLTLARNFGLGLSVLSSDANFDALRLESPLYLDGRKLSKPRMESIYEEMTAAFNKMSRQAQGIKDPHRPWLAKNAIELDNTPLSEWIAELHCKPLTRLAIEEQFSNDGGAPTAEQSLLANLAVVAGAAHHNKHNAFFTQTEVLRCSEGNQELAERLAQAIRDSGGTVNLSSPVSAILVTKENATVELENAAAFTADYAILAIPPNLWPGKATAKIAIDPELPCDYYVTMGTSVKYLSTLKHRFWIRESLAPTATSDQFGVTWEATDNQIAEPGKDVGLSLFAGGHVAQDALKAFDLGGQSEVRAFYEPLIGAIYPGYDANVSQPPNLIAWPRDEWTAGGYACPKPGEVCRAGPLLRKGFRKRLFFAGEHTCPAYYGYMEGALQSGKTVASTILKRI